MHKEVLTLSMDRDAMKKFVAQSNKKSGATNNTSLAPTGSFTQAKAKSAIESCLDHINKSNTSGFRFRLAAEQDLPTVGRLVQGLADYVKESDAVHLSADDYHKDGFSKEEEPYFYCLLVDSMDSEGKWYTCGYAFCFFGYIVGEGRFLYLEDLFLEVDYRQRGGGKLVMQILSQICLALDCTHLYWQALDWNNSGLEFYDKIGAKIHEGEKTSRYCGEALMRFAEQGPE